MRRGKKTAPVARPCRASRHHRPCGGGCSSLGYARPARSVGASVAPGRRRRDATSASIRRSAPCRRSRPAHRGARAARRGRRPGGRRRAARARQGRRPVRSARPARPAGPPGPAGSDRARAASGPPAPRVRAAARAIRARRVPRARRASRACRAPRACRDRQGAQGPKGPPGPPGAYGDKNDSSARKRGSRSAPALVATAVASCDRAADLLVTGGCYADPQWMAQLVAARPVAMTDARNPASWRCDYRNTSPSSTIEIVAEAYCVRPRE